MGKGVSGFAVQEILEEDLYDDWSGPKRLLAGVLSRAVGDLNSPDPNERKDAARWIFLPCSEHVSWTFPWICMCLDLDKKMIRSKAVEKRPELRSFLLLDTYSNED